MLGIVANGDHCLDFTRKKLVHVLLTIFGNIDTDVGEYGNGEGVDKAGGIGSSTLYI